MAKDGDNSQGTVPANRRADPPERRSPAASPVRRNEHGSPMPEFLSLTYTLPHHLIVQIEDLAEETNRSPSEVLAESFRLYLQVRQGMERRAKVSTVNGFAYQEVELAEAVLDEETVARLSGPAPAREPGPAPTADAPAEPTPPEPGTGADAGTPEPPGAEPATEVGTPADAKTPEAPDTEPATGVGTPTDADAPEAPSAEPTVEDPQRETGEAGLGPDTDVHEGGDAASTLEGESPGEVDGDAAPTPEPEPESHEEAHEESGTTGWEALANVNRRPAAPETEHRPTPESDDEDASQPETTGPSEPLRASPGPSADEDAAEEVRGRLLPLADEPLDSERLRRVLEAIMRDVDRKEHTPPEHSRKVAGLARRLAELKGLEGQDLLIVELAGLVHDIGKACVPDELIRHIRLTKEELAFVRRYPEMGAELLATVPALESVAGLVRLHQERWDGSGYPEGREGSQIPLGAQIVALCDIYDTLITERRYRPAYTEERAVQIIRENVGKLWNPDVASPFVKKLLADT